MSLPILFPLSILSLASEIKETGINIDGGEVKDRDNCFIEHFHDFITGPRSNVTPNYRVWERTGYIYKRKETHSMYLGKGLSSLLSCLLGYLIHMMTVC